MHDPEEHTHTRTDRQPDSQTARQAGLVSYANATFTDLLSWLPTRPTRDTLPSRTTDTQDVLLHDSTSNKGEQHARRRQPSGCKQHAGHSQHFEKRQHAGRRQHAGML
ncbi:hypothetical protein M433DRAFT_159461 [Acidomyces richmondensis BFW]|nr:hypothetical protein M433DRAFT_159461 [Acidomyces richmondensis BFW]